MTAVERLAEIITVIKQELKPTSVEKLPLRGQSWHGVCSLETFYWVKQ